MKIAKLLARTWWGQGRRTDAIRLMGQCVYRRERAIEVNIPEIIVAPDYLSLWGEDVENSSVEVPKKSHGKAHMGMWSKVQRTIQKKTQGLSYRGRASMVWEKP